jgi:hypothetical protein
MAEGGTRAQPTKEKCAVCGRAFTNVSQYTYMGGKLRCRGKRDCARRKAGH